MEIKSDITLRIEQWLQSQGYATQSYANLIYVYAKPATRLMGSEDALPSMDGPEKIVEISTHPRHHLNKIKVTICNQHDKESYYSIEELLAYKSFEELIAWQRFENA